MKTHNSFDEQFEFTGSVKTWSLIAIVIGVVAIAFGFLTGSVERTFANLLLMGYYFTCVCLCGVFFCADAEEIAPSVKMIANIKTNCFVIISFSPSVLF